MNDSSLTLEGLHMVDKYKVVTLCGSTRFKDEFIAVEKRLTLEGNIVLSVGFFGEVGDSAKEMLDDMHKRKIDMADEILVINVDGYIGSSTQSEIEYAKTAGKPVRYLENHEDCFIPCIDFDEAMAKLKTLEKDIRRYFEVMRMAETPENPEFRKKFNAFYRVRRDEAWRSEFYQLMEDFRKKDDPYFGEVLLRLHQRTGQIEPSFASKMLATLNADMPIWDSNILRVLHLKLTGTTPELKLSNAVVLYDKIRRWYQDFLQTETARGILQRFDREFPEFTDMSPTKKIDFVLWASV